MDTNREKTNKFMTQIPIQGNQDHCIWKVMSRMTKKITMAKKHTITCMNILQNQTNLKHTHLHQVIYENSSNQTPISALQHKFP